METVTEPVPDVVNDGDPVTVAESDKVEVLPPVTDADIDRRGDELVELLKEADGDESPVLLVVTEVVRAAVGVAVEHAVAETVHANVAVTEPVDKADSEMVPLTFAVADEETDRDIVSDPDLDPDAHRVELLH